MHQKDIEEKDPFGQNGDDEAEADDDDEKSFLKALLAERALKNDFQKTQGNSRELGFLQGKRS